MVYQKNKSLELKRAKNQEEFISLAKEEGVELTDEQLEGVSGETCSFGKACDKRCSHSLTEISRDGEAWWRCNDCGYEFKNYDPFAL